MLGAVADGVDAGQLVSSWSSTRMPRPSRRPAASASAVSARTPAAITTSAAGRCAARPSARRARRADAPSMARSAPRAGPRMPLRLDRRLEQSRAPPASSWRSISAAMMWTSVTGKPRARQAVSRLDAEQPAANHDGAARLAAARCRHATSARSRKVMTPARRCPGMRQPDGVEPVASTSRSKARPSPSRATIRAARVEREAGRPVSSAMPFSAYQARGRSSTSAASTSPASRPTAARGCRPAAAPRRSRRSSKRPGADCHQLLDQPEARHPAADHQQAFAPFPT